MQKYTAPQVVRAAAILTNGYVAGTDIESTQQYNQAALLIAFTIGSLTDCDIKIEFSHDDTTYYQESFGTTSGAEDTLSAGHHTIAATGNYYYTFPIKARYIRVSAIGNGTVTSSSLALSLILGVS